MADPFLAEIRMVSFAFAPRGWALCNGQLLPINQNQALFSLLGTTYGGNGQTTFALPNLQGRVPIHTGGGFFLGESAGETAHTLTAPEMPPHTHPALASGIFANRENPAGNYWADGRVAAYAAGADSLLSPEAIAPAGGSQPHDNHDPYLVINFIIALQVIFPARE